MTSAADLLAEQLWATSIAGGDVRLGYGSPPPGWREQESYWVFPSAEHARLFLPRGPRTVTAGAALHYRGLRRPSKNIGRYALGTAARAGLPLSRDLLSVWVKDAAAASRLPLARLADELGTGRLYASFGVRRGANRKATLFLLDGLGRPVGYAKLGWSTTTDSFVRTEARTLREVGGRSGSTRAPALLAEIDNQGHPIIVTEPLPLDVRGSRDPGVAAPSPQELHALMPVVRRASVDDSAQLRDVVARLEKLPAGPVTQAEEVLDRSRRLASLVLACRDVVPLTSRWHGDFAPWNRARSRDGQLWVWDWENSEEDAVAGLDALHWFFSERRPASGRATSVDLGDSLARAGHHLVAAGVPRSAHGLVAAIYALTVLERALDLATRSGGWETLWITPRLLRNLSHQAESLLAR